ncbi:periplasmic binding protein-like I [Polychytrium aggregatum]|uniref:periplasmic binding protein-like I n=1 Tax=Polychytrium aggregatum TaxID=110093 RepID=UPI0022FDBFA8|nr:periplasmic binding protein-like I [Polychytrium aggregatum]KAI9193294.1 periplasmic binding protein-like I [Polychytrium aggregatum]
MRRVAEQIWGAVALMYSREPFGTTARDDAKSVANAMGFNIVLEQGFYGPTQGNRSDLAIPLENLQKSRAKIIIVCAIAQYTSDLYYMAYGRGLVGPTYVWMGINIPYYNFMDFSWFNGDPIQAAQGFIWATQNVTNGAGYNEFNSKWNSMSLQNATMYPLLSGDLWEWGVRGVYDAAYIMALAWTNLTRIYPDTPFLQLLATNSTYPLRAVGDLIYDGASGFSIFNGDGIMAGPFVISVVVSQNSTVEYKNIAYYENDEIITDCHMCQYYNFDGSTKVPSDSLFEVCPPGWQSYSSEVVSQLCVPCPEGTYNLNSNSTCKPCPVGAVCHNANIMIAKGYWYNANASAIDSAFYLCDATANCCPNACPIGGGNQCIHEHSGVLCSQCPSGQYEWGGQCTHCDSLGSNIAVGVAAFVAIFVVVCILCVIPTSKEGFLVDLIFVYQVAYLLDFDHTTALSRALAFLTLSLNIQSGGNGCILPLDQFAKMISAYVMVMAMVVCLGLWHVLIQVLRSPNRGPLARRAWKTIVRWFPYLDTSFKHSLTRSVIVLALFSFSPVYSTAVTILSCRAIEGFPSVVWDYPSVQCWTDSHTTVAVLSGIVVVVQVIVLPGVIFRQGLGLRSKQQPEPNTPTLDADIANEAVVVPIESEATDPLYVLHRCYTEQCRWWTAIDLIERSTIVGLPLLLRSTGDYTPRYAALFVLWMFLLVRAFVMPYRLVADNAVRIIGYLALIITFSLQLRQKYLLDQYGIESTDSLVQETVATIIPCVLLVPTKLFSKIPSAQRKQISSTIRSIRSKVIEAGS